MYLSEHRQRFGWETWVMGRRSSAAATAESIGDRTRRRIDLVDVDVLSVLLPHVETSGGMGTSFDRWANAQAGSLPRESILWTVT